MDFRQTPVVQSITTNFQFPPAEKSRLVLGSIARPWGFSAGNVDQVAETVFAVASMTSVTGCDLMFWKIPSKAGSYKMYSRAVGILIVATIFLAVGSTTQRSSPSSRSTYTMLF